MNELYDSQCMANMDIGLNIYWFWNLTGTEYKLTAYLENQLSNLYFNLMTPKVGAMVERVLFVVLFYPDLQIWWKKWLHIRKGKGTGWSCLSKLRFCEGLWQVGCFFFGGGSCTVCSFFIINHFE